MNIIEPVLFQCKLNPLALAICVPGAQIESVTYGELERLIHNSARMALASGLHPGSVVAVHISNNTVLHASLVLGLMHAGMTVLSLRETAPVPGINPDVILTNSPGLFGAGPTVLAVDESWLQGGGALEPVAAHGSGSDTCRIILTSGSTGVSKGIAFSHDSLAARITHYAYAKGPRFARCSRLYCDLGIGTSPGFRYAITMLSRGGTVFYLGPEPADILQAISLHEIEGMATSPYGLGEFLRVLEADSAFDVTFDHIICQGAMLSPALSHRARSRICQNLYSSYGSTETTTVAFGPASVTERVPGAVGYIQPGVRVEVVDPSGVILPPMQDGELRIRTEHMADGYVGDPETTQRLFRDGCFYSGDMGHVTADGLLVVTGRIKTALNIGGDTISPEKLEEVITAFPGIREAGAFSVNNDLGIAELHALIVTASPIDESGLRRHCAARLSPSRVPVRFIVVDAIPRGGQGKLERHRFAELAAAKTRAG
jgi:acyl-CoA synthetase (AMP-forming)/AMP-acid ligase II